MIPLKFTYFSQLAINNVTQNAKMAKIGFSSFQLSNDKTLLLNFSDQ